MLLRTKPLNGRLTTSMEMIGMSLPMDLVLDRWSMLDLVLRLVVRPSSTGIIWLMVGSYAVGGIELTAGIVTDPFDRVDEY
jgi:hypothetical protein